MVAGPAGSGKTTLAHAIAAAVGCPAICRDEIKEGMVHTTWGHAAAGFVARPGDELTARTVRVRGGVPAVTDGPYIEAKEFVSSFFLLDVDSEQRALDIAAEYPFAAHNAVEVWPILHESGETI